MAAGALPVDGTGGARLPGSLRRGGEDQRRATPAGPAERGRGLAGLLGADELHDRNTDFMDPFNIGQLADDTALYADNINSLKQKFEKVLKFSKEKGQVANMKKTKYIHFSDKPSTTPLVINQQYQIHPIEDGSSQRYLGVNFIPCSTMEKILIRNINDRMYNVHKFYGWLEVNTNTPIEVKLLVLDSGVFSALLYSAETWRDILVIKDKLISIELKALKAIMNVKKGTSNDLIYYELGRGTIYSKLLDQQWKFFQKFRKLSPDESFCISIYNLCKQTDFIKYYENLHGHNYTDDIKERNNRINVAETSMVKYYREFKFERKCSIYSNFMIDSNRAIITRWRLSNHTLKIETGRYENPPLIRNERKCKCCDIVEDEKHVIFVCPAYNNLRQSFSSLFVKNNSVGSFLDPPYNEANKVAGFLYAIEKVREKMKLK